jgi:hypothetical protein
MTKKDAKRESLPPIRVDAKLKKELETEAEREGLDLTAYIRRLLITDPRRKKGTGK